MKKWFLPILMVLLVFGFAACRQDAAQGPTVPLQTQPPVTEAPPTEPPATEPPPTEPIDGALLGSLNLTGMDAAAAVEALTAEAAGYTLTLTVNDTPITLTAEELALTVDEAAVTAYIEALKAGTADPLATPVVTYDGAAVVSAISRSFDRHAQNARIVFDGNVFQLKKESEGQLLDDDDAVAAAQRAICLLQTEAAAAGSYYPDKPTVLAASQTSKDALTKANSYLGISLAYRFAPTTAGEKTHTVSRSDIASFISFGRDLTPSVSRGAVESYAAKLGEQYGIPGEPGKFMTTGGYTININVTYAGELVDVDHLAADLYSCVTKGTSGTREAKYLPREEAGDLSFGGNYIEVNQSAQYMWVYRNGKCVTSSPVVTGCVYYGWYTPNGIYTVNKKAMHSYLYGANYTTYVKYWIGFIGNSYGFHDASWRDSFGGDIYLRDGSHGCVNMPLNASGAIYDQAYVGMKVIIYGGATKADPVEQRMTGTTEYTVAADAKPFQLDTKMEYPVSTMTYHSDNTAVAAVGADGTVTVKAPGKAVITATAPAAEYYTAGELKITVTVISPCDEGRHVFEAYTLTKAPTCGVAGVETAKCENCTQVSNRTVAATGQHTPVETTTQATCTAAGEKVTACSVCGAELGRETAGEATGHSFSADSPVCGNGCGVQNPDYVAPTDPPETEPETEPETQPETEPEA